LTLDILIGVDPYSQPIGEILDGLAAPSNIDQGLTLPNLAVMST
jgi:hypothetical protein